MDHALIALLALLLNLALGGPRALYEASGAARLARIPAKLLRDREPFFTKENQPILLVGYALAMACAAGLFFHFILRGNIQFLEIIIVACLLPVRPSLERLWFIRKALASGDVQAARKQLEGTVWKHHVLLDEHGVARAAAELVAVTFCERVLHPLIWYLLLGLPGLFVCRSVTLMKEALPSSFNAEGYIHQLTFGMFKLTSWVSSRLCAIIWLMASLFVPPSDVVRAGNQLAATATSAPALAYAIEAVAAVLGAALGGPTSAYASQQWLGSGSAKLAPAQLYRLLIMSGFALVVMLLLLGLFAS
jgi:adenosylcobinamide-phosphate synthase